MDLLIETTGTVRCVFGEEIDLGQLGRLSIRRGSHVEPTPDGQWTADLTPSMARCWDRSHPNRGGQRRSDLAPGTLAVAVAVTVSR
ncbi:MAG: hypothetical protein U0935_20335 [Pirellulales bacterium]